jgi:RNA ligase (TIGR02306 family)
MQELLTDLGIENGFKVEVVEIKSVIKHPNADRLDCLTFNNYDWVVVAGRENPEEPRYKAGDSVIYIPIDSILPPKLECFLFPPGSLITLSKSRVKSIKIRKCVSQGMTCDLSEDLFSLYPELRGAKLGDDLTKILGIVKYEPPVGSTPSLMAATSKKKSNPHFKEYLSIPNFKYFPDAFDGKDVVVTEKLHGTSTRYANLPRVPVPMPRFPDNFRWTSAKHVWNILKEYVGGVRSHVVEKVLFKIGKLPSHEFCLGSRRVQLQTKSKDHKVWYDENVYGIVAQNYGFRDTLLPGEALYGEIVGQGIQAKYNYGCAEGEYKFFAYDVKFNDRYLDHDDFVAWCTKNEIPRVPELYRGIYDREKIDAMRKGDSRIGNQKIREGVVVQTAKEDIDPRLGRLILKWISDDYLTQKGSEDLTDFH